jgi:hypothetical protein
VWEGGKLHVQPGSSRFIPLPTHGPLFAQGAAGGWRGGSEGGEEEKGLDAWQLSKRFRAYGQVPVEREGSGLEQSAEETKTEL